MRIVTLAETDGNRLRAFLADEGHTPTHVRVAYNRMTPEGPTGCDMLWPRGLAIADDGEPLPAAD